MTDPTAWSAAIARSAALMADLRTDGIRLRMLNLGGGFPSRYLSYIPRLTQVGRPAAAVRAHRPDLRQSGHDPVDAALSEGIAVGDTVFIHSAGAYTTSHASRFNGFDAPPTLCRQD
jgi:ornithine decarboxylase